MKKEMLRDRISGAQDAAIRDDAKRRRTVCDERRRCPIGVTSPSWITQSLVRRFLAVPISVPASP